MAEAYIAEIRLFAGNFAPRGWMSCEGQLLSIAQNTALFSLLGTTYGGNGVNTFALPDFRGRSAVGQGQGPGLSPYVEGQTGGAETVTLSTNQLPAHNHALTANSNTTNMSANTAGNYLNGKTESGESTISSGSALVTLNPASVGATGGNQPHENRPPYLSMFFIICVESIFPSRN